MQDISKLFNNFRAKWFSDTTHLTSHTRMAQNFVLFLSFCVREFCVALFRKICMLLAISVNLRYNFKIKLCMNEGGN